MTESQHTARLLKELRRREPQAVILKHADAYTMGVPDFSVTVGYNTMWCEAKRLDDKRVIPPMWSSSDVKLENSTMDSAIAPAMLRFRPKVDVPAIQWETLLRLGRGYVVLYTKYGYAMIYVARARNLTPETTLPLKTLPELLKEISEAVRVDLSWR